MTVAQPSSVLESDLSSGLGGDDPLLDCLHIITRLHGRPVSQSALIGGLPLANKRLTPALFIRAAERHGYAARVVKRSLTKLSRLLLPAVLILKDSGACVLTEYGKRKTAKVVFPEAGFAIKDIAVEELARQFTGFVIFVQPTLRIEEARLGLHAFKPSSPWFWSILWRFKRYYLEAMFAGVLVNVLTVAISLFTMNVYDRVVPNNATDTLYVLAAGTALAVGFEFAARSLRSYFLEVAGKKADLLLASRLFAQALGLKMAVRPASSGSFSAQLREYESLRDFMTSATLTTVMDLPFVAFFIWIISLIGGPLFLVPLLTVPVVVAVGLIAQLPLSYLMRSHLREGALRHAVLIESIEGMENLKALCAEGVMLGKYENYVAMTGKSATRAREISSFVVNFSYLAQQISTIALVVWGVDLIGKGDLTSGALIATVILAGRGLAPLQQVAALLTRYQYARSTYITLNELMHRPIERPEDRQFIHRPLLSGAIQFERTRFAYPNAKLEVLREISFTLRPREHVAILGRIGSGKTTLLKLILGLYTPQAGAIRLDDVDLEQFDPVDVRRHIGYVGQELQLFYGTLRDNVALGTPHATDEEIVAASRLAGLDKLINHHPQGFDMIVGERGEGLSGGQKQTIAIARALLKRPSIMLLDEPTSAMDHSAEQAFITNMRQYLENRTLVLVTHKPTLLALVSRIIVIENGQVALDGPRDEVLKRLMAQAGPPQTSAQ